MKSTFQTLFFEVTSGVGNEQMLAASRLLSQHDDAFWLRQFLEPGDFATHRRYERVTEIPDVTRRSPFHGGPIQHLRWDQIGDLLREGVPTSSSETAVLAVAASLVGEYDINLRDTLAVLDDDQVQLVIAAVTEAASQPARDDHAVTAGVLPAQAEPGNGPAAGGDGRGSAG